MKARHLIIPIVLLASCQIEQENPALMDSPAGTFVLSLQASKGEATTKALDLVSGTPDRLNAYWKDTEKVKVYKGGSFLGTLDVTPAAETKPTTATLSGSITIAGLNPGDILTLMIPRQTWSYTGQNGALTGSGSIEDTYDYATASVTIDTVDDVNNIVTTTSGANFENQQSVYRFSFKEGGNYIEPKAFTVSSANLSLASSIAWNGSAWASTYDEIEVTPASAAGDHLYYVAIRNESTASDTYTFRITGSDDVLYVASQAIPSGVLDTPGKFISAKNINATKTAMAPSPGIIDEPEKIL